jgi:hypothetical protein
MDHRQFVQIQPTMFILLKPETAIIHGMFRQEGQLLLAEPQTAIQ